VTFNLPVFHPLILGSVAGATYALIKHGEAISYHLINMPDYAAETFKKMTTFES